MNSVAPSIRCRASHCGPPADVAADGGPTHSVQGVILFGVATDGITHRQVRTNGISMHIAEAGEGPLVLLLHGFPELWYSFRGQLGVLAEAGFHAVAPDLRGYGRTDAPPRVEDYTLLHSAGDIVGLLDALGEQECVLVGHDWGSPLAASLALFRTDLVRGLAMLSTPYFVRRDEDFLTELNCRLGPDNYQTWFQQPGEAEAVFEADVRGIVRASLLATAGEAEQVHSTAHLDVDSGPMPTFDELPAWLTEEDIDYYAAEFSRTGYRGAMNWYRNHKANWELMAAWHQAPILVPALFVTGDRDPVMNWPGMFTEVEVTHRRLIPRLTKSVTLPGCGHWTQQERSREVNDLLLEFLAALGSADDDR
jgi:pimeloyl-ACP methyl ester carboxylesterase